MRGAGRARGGGGGGRGIVGTARGPPRGRGGARAPGERVRPGAAGRPPLPGTRESLGDRGGEGTLAARPAFRSRGPGSGAAGPGALEPRVRPGAGGGVEGGPAASLSGSPWAARTSSAGRQPPRAVLPASGLPGARGGRRLALPGPGCFPGLLASLPLLLLGCGLVINPFPSKVGPRVEVSRSVQVPELLPALGLLSRVPFPAPGRRLQWSPSPLKTQVGGDCGDDTHFCH